MSLSSITRLGACALLVFASSAASAQSSVGVGVQIGGEPVGEAVNDGDRPATHPFCLRSTGTHIRMKARTVDTDADADGKADRVDCVAANGRVYTRRDLETTGAIDIADALRRLDPAIR